MFEGNIGFFLRGSRGIGSYLEMRWRTRGSSQVVAGKSEFLLSGDGYFGNLLSCITGIKPHFEF